MCGATGVTLLDGWQLRSCLLENSEGKRTGSVSWPTSVPLYACLPGPSCTLHQVSNVLGLLLAGVVAPTCQWTSVLDSGRELGMAASPTLSMAPIP